MPNKKKILLLSYYFRPCTYVAANRPNSFAKELVKYGFDVVVITRHWKGDEQVWLDYVQDSGQKIEIEKEDGLTIHRLPYRQKKLSNNRYLGKLQLLQRLITGNLQMDVDYYQFKPYIDQLISKNNFDLVIASSPPLNIVRLTYELCKKHSLKYFIDVRDFANDVILYTNLKTPFSRLMMHQFTLIHAAKWFRDASLVFTITPPLTEYMAQKFKCNAITILNGFNERLLEVNETQYAQFHITLMGSVYDIPELDEMLEGLTKLFDEPFAKDIKMQFIGTATTEHFIKKIKAAVPTHNLVMKNRMSQEDAQKESARSQLLLVLGFRGKSGVIGTKPFEYMGLRKTLIQMPGDKDIMQKIILECNAGYCPSDVYEFVEVVKNIYYEWKKNGSIQYKGNIFLIKQYSREEQVKKILPYLN